MYRVGGLAAGWAYGFGCRRASDWVFPKVAHAKIGPALDTSIVESLHTVVHVPLVLNFVVFAGFAHPRILPYPSQCRKREIASMARASML